MTNTESTQPRTAFGHLYDVIARLRGEGGCPWDREQTPLSLRGDLLEETYECLEAIGEGEPEHIKEELGDVLFLVIIIAYMHEQADCFTVAGVLEEAAQKLIRRHPHVFGETRVNGTAEVLQNWEKIKIEQEGRKPKDSVLDTVSKGMPALDRAYKLQKKAAKAGFDWPDVNGVTAKIREELAEAEEAMGKDHAELEGELGDLLFSVVNLCRFLKVDPSLALTATNAKFTERFKHVERRMRETGREMKKENLDLMDGFWEEAKR